MAVVVLEAAVLEAVVLVEMVLEAVVLEAVVLEAIRLITGNHLFPMQITKNSLFLLQHPVVQP